MSFDKSYLTIHNRYSRILMIVSVIFVIAAATIAKDFLYSRIQDTSFYFSESLLFSTFWLLFMPLLHAQWYWIRHSSKFPVRMLIVIISTALHLLIYPALVWLMSASFYPNTFSYWQTFNFGMTEYSLMSVIIYGISAMIIANSKKRLRDQTQPVIKEDLFTKNFIESIIVSESNNKKIAIAIEDVVYFSSNSPYVNIHHPAKKYLVTGTLKSLKEQLNSHQFVRIHRSNIVNIFKVVSYTSRRNGDYDLTLTDNTILRVSRNYAADFKRKFEEHYQVATK